MPFLSWDVLGEVLRRNIFVKAKIGERSRSFHEAYLVDRIQVDEKHTVEQDLINFFLEDPDTTKRLHLRRSLDQYGFPGIKDSASREADQILHKSSQHRNLENWLDFFLKQQATKENLRKISRTKHATAIGGFLDKIEKWEDVIREHDQSKSLVVDQLWLWVVDEGISDL
jgi:hypothetical protein